LLGVPFDANSSHLRGAARAPTAIRRALDSAAGNAYSERGVCVWPSDTVVDLGDLRVPARAACRGPLDLIEKGVARALEVAPRILLLGGDHAVTYPALRAVAARHGRISLLHFDAHPDLYPDFDGNPYSHACPMARILEDGLVDRLVQVGIRSHTPEQAAMAARYGVEVHHASALVRPPKLRFRSPLYVSVDIDALDPAFAPGVSHPEPGGLSVRWLLDVLASTQAPALLAADVVELNPARDSGDATAVVAAKLVRELLARLTTSV
jgi:agmatinase